MSQTVVFLVYVVSWAVALVLSASLCMDFLRRGDSAALAWEEDMMLVVSLSSAHTQALLWYAVGRQIEKLKEVWFLEVLNVAFHFQVCLNNVIK